MSGAKLPYLLKFFFYYQAPCVAIPASVEHCQSYFFCNCNEIMEIEKAKQNKTKQTNKKQSKLRRHLDFNWCKLCGSMEIKLNVGTSYNSC